MPQVRGRSRQNTLVVSMGWRLLLIAGTAIAVAGCSAATTSVHVGVPPRSVSPGVKAVVVGPQPRQLPTVAAPYCVPASTTTTPGELQMLKEIGDTSGTIPPSNLPTCSTVTPRSAVVSSTSP